MVRCPSQKHMQSVCRDTDVSNLAWIFMNSETISLSNQPRTTNNGHGLFARTGNPRNFVMFAPQPFFSDDYLVILLRGNLGHPTQLTEDLLDRRKLLDQACELGGQAFGVDGGLVGSVG